MNGPPPADTLLAALTRLAALEPAQAALCADGHSWCTRAELLAWARAAACPEPPAVEVSGPRPWVGRVAARDVPAADPLGAVLALVAAEDARSVPVVRDPDWPAEIVAAQVALAERLGGSWPADPGEPAAVLAVGVPEHVLAGGWDAASLLVLPTSGSSAVPRLVVRTARSWLDSLAPFSAVTGIGREDVVWAPGPPAATLTLFAIWHALAGGLPVIASGRWRGVVPAGHVAAEADVVQCVPAVLADVVEARESGLLPRLRTAVVAGARLSGALRRRAEAAGLSVVEYYGATELSFVAVDPDGAGLRPFPGVELDLRNGGEIWVRSPYLALGYLDPATGGPLRRDPGGWCTVGDHGTLRPDGSLAVHGRGDRALSVGGHTVLTADVEAVLAEVDGVSELVCLAQPHHRLGERVVAAVRPAAGCDPVPDLRRAARTRLPVAARPVRYLLFADFPRTPGGKVDRTRLRDQVLADLGARPGAGPAHRSAAPERASAARDAPEPAPAVAGPPSGRPAAPSGTEPAAHLSGSARLPG